MLLLTDLRSQTITIGFFSTIQWIIVKANLTFADGCCRVVKRCAGDCLGLINAQPEKWVLVPKFPVIQIIVGFCLIC